MMKLSEIVREMSLESLQDEFEDVIVKTAYTSDLLSDVMGNAQQEALFITIQSHKNSVAVASLINSPAILVCNNRPVPEEMIKAANKEGIAILRTKLNQYEASAKIYNILNSEV